MMGKYCGASIQPSYISSSKEIMVHFETDGYNGNENGFKMEYNPTGKQNTSIQNNIGYFSSFLKDMYLNIVSTFTVCFQNGQFLS